MVLCGSVDLLGLSVRFSIALGESVFVFILVSVDVLKRVRRCDLEG